MGTNDCPLCWIEAHTGNPGKRLSTPLQLEHLQKTFLDLNPGYALDVIDWSIISETEPMGTNIEVFERENPEFRWERPDERTVGQYDRMAIDALADEAEPYGYELIRARKLEGLQKLPGRLKKVKVALEKCQAAGPQRGQGPGVCKIKTVDVVAHSRCMPRAGVHHE